MGGVRGTRNRSSAALFRGEKHRGEGGEEEEEEEAVSGFDAL